MYAGLRRIVHRLGLRNTGELARFLGSGELLHPVATVTAGGLPSRRGRRVCATSTTSRRAPRWSSVARVVPTRSHCSRSCARDGLDVTAVYVDHGLRAGTAHDAEVVSRPRPPWCGATASVEVDVDGRGQSRGPGPRRRYDVARRRGAPTLRTRRAPVGHTLRRPGGDGPARPVAGQRHRRARGNVRAPRGRCRSGVRSSALRRADTRELCARLGFEPVHDPMNDDRHHRRVWLRREVIPRARSRRRSRSGRGARPAGRRVARRRRAPLRARGRSRRPTTLVRCALCPGPSPAAWCGRGSAARRRRSRPSMPCSRSRAVSAAPCRSRAGARVERAGRAAASRRATDPGADEPPGPSGSGCALPGRALRRGRGGGLDRGGAAGRLARRGPARRRRRRSAPAPTRASGSPGRPSGSAPSVAGARSSSAARSPKPACPRAVAAQAPIVVAGAAAAVAADTAIWVVGYRVDDRVRVDHVYAALPLVECGPMLTVVVEPVIAGRA